ncbi:TonB family protein [Opitutus terrae]|uniref:TonB family protein n=1 Tax=Opitutus terrae (strain DSM 11246 / JCM 15787 / PB90-1) TaxID=452637 RepID=B1ZVY0_OPITP|nr:TonB family protein [Opitutus terrae]ACB75066.1 TonB family protein [Opitutus terrae PB90-1]
MNIRSLFSLLAGLATVSAFAALPEYTPMKVIQTEPVMYPRQLSDLGVTTGEVHVAVQVDETGKLTDHLVTAYTHPKFAEAAVDALNKWRFEPAVVKGQPCSATVDLTFVFETRGMVVVNMTISSYVEMRTMQLRPTANSYSVCRLSELDAIPTPAKVVTPGYPADAAKQGQPGQVTVFFYIDEQGRVRLPAVSRESSLQYESFAAAALDAVSQWQFEPPMSKGRPVLVAARQDFTFKPAPVAAAAPAPTATR